MYRGRGEHGRRKKIFQDGSKPFLKIQGVKTQKIGLSIVKIRKVTKIGRESRDPPCHLMRAPIVGQECLTEAHKFFPGTTTPPPP